MNSQPALQGADGHLPGDPHLLKLHVDPPAREGGNPTWACWLCAVARPAVMPAQHPKDRPGRTAACPGNSLEQLGSQTHHEHGLCVVAPQTLRRASLSLTSPRGTHRLGGVDTPVLGPEPQPAASTSAVPGAHAPQPHIDSSQTQPGDSTDHSAAANLGFCTCLLTSHGAFKGLLWSPYRPPKY